MWYVSLCVCIYVQQGCLQLTTVLINLPSVMLVLRLTPVQLQALLWLVLSCLGFFEWFAACARSEAGEISSSGSHKAISGICISFSRYETYNVGDLDSTAWFYKAVIFFFLTRFVMSKRTHFKHSLSVITCQRILFKTFEKGKYSGRYLFVFYTRLRSYREQGYINKQLIIYYYYLLSMLAAHICGMCHLSVNWYQSTSSLKMFVCVMLSC